MHASRADLPAQGAGGVRGSLRRLGRDPRRDRDHARQLPAGRVPVPGPARRPLPVPALGLRRQGSFTVTYLDGSEERVDAGDVYHLRPGHFVQTLEPTELVEFSPVDEHDKTMSVVDGQRLRGDRVMMRSTMTGYCAKSIEELPRCGTALPSSSARDSTSRRSGPTSGPAARLLDQGPRRVRVASRSSTSPCAGRASVDIGDERQPLDADHLVRVDAGTARVLSSGPEGLRVLCIGGVPGGVYEPRSGARPAKPRSTAASVGVA